MTMIVRWLMMMMMVLDRFIDADQVRVVATEVMQARPSPSGVGLLAANYDFRPTHMFERSPRNTKGTLL